jgi:hypothetical protein
MRKINLLLMAFIASLAVDAQPQSYVATAEYQKTPQTAAGIDLPYTSDIVLDAIKDQMAKKGIRGIGLKGYTLYRGVRLSDSATVLNDLYFKVDRKSRQEKNVSVVTLIVVNPSEDPATRAAGGAGMNLDQPRSFLNDLAPVAEARNLEADITGEQDILKKSQKKYNTLQDDQSDLEKKLRYAQADLEQNKKDQLTQTQVMQASIHGDDDAMKKAQKRMNRLVDDQGSLQKKIRKYQADLDQNKKDQETGKADVQKQQQLLDSMKTRRKN